LVEEKSDKFGPRLLLEIGASSVRLRFNSAEDVEIWRAGLEEWRRYAEEHGDPPSLAPRPHPLAADLFEETEEEKEPARDLPEAMMTQNPLTLTVSTLEERELGDDDVGIQRQKLLPVSIEEEVSTKKPKLFGGIRSLLGKKSPAHAPLPSEAARGDLESPPRSGASYDRIQTSSPFHKPPERSLDGDRMSPRATSSSKPVPATSVLEQKPEALEGWLEKKNKGGLGNVMKIGHSWNRR
jgi:hypothetical protein